jgi:N-acetylmuramoyl-L-alanine amidase
MKTTLSDPTNVPRRAPLGFLRQLWIVLGISALLATLFTAWTPVGLFTGGLVELISRALAPRPEEAALVSVITPTSRPKPRVGIVAGHWGNDPGAVCADGLTEAQVNLNIATLVKQGLVDNGFDVDLLEEFDPLLSQYQALALVSIHADSCEYVNDQATGYKVAAALGTANADKATRLTACIRSRYSQYTSLPYHGTSITPDMTSYHAFDEIHSDTPAAIIETGFLNLDRQILTQEPDRIADAITQGILCYIYNEDISAPTVP